MDEKQFFNQSLFRKVLYFEWALLFICALMQILVINGTVTIDGSPNHGTKVAVLIPIKIENKLGA